MKMRRQIYEDNAAPDQTAHPCSLIRELYHLLISQRDTFYVNQDSVALRSDCADEQAYLYVHIPRMSKDQFPCDTAQLTSTIKQ